MNSWVVALPPMSLVLVPLVGRKMGDVSSYGVVSEKEGGEEIFQEILLCLTYPSAITSYTALEILFA